MREACRPKRLQMHTDVSWQVPTRIIAVGKHTATKICQLDDLLILRQSYSGKRFVNSQVFWGPQVDFPVHSDQGIEL